MTGQMTFTQCWCYYTVKMHAEATSHANYEETMNLVFTNCSKEIAVYPLRAESQEVVIMMRQLQTQLGHSVQLVKNTTILCKDSKLVIFKDLQDRAVAWYHHYLQHPSLMCLEETFCSGMYWKGM